MTRTGLHSGLEKHCFHQAEEPLSPNLRKGGETFVFVCVSTKERSWLRFIKRAGSKRNTFSCESLLISRTNNSILMGFYNERSYIGEQI